MLYDLRVTEVNSKVIIHVLVLRMILKHSTKGDSDHNHHKEAIPGAAEGSSVIKSELSVRHSQDKLSDNSGLSESECDSDMEVLGRDSTSAKKTVKKDKKFYNSKKFTGAYLYKTKFDDKWLKNHPDCKGIIVPAANDPYAFRCKVCDKDVSCAHQGKRDLMRHVVGKGHVSKLRAKSNVNHVTELFVKQDSAAAELARKAEVKFIGFLAEHHLSLSAADLLDEDQKSPVVVVTRVENFSACHRLHSKLLSSEENETLFGKCNNKNGHGHNYTIEVSVKGKVDKITGMVMNISDLKEIIKVSVLDILDHKNLDLDVAYFNNIVSTTENLAVFIWKQISSALPQPSMLYKIKIHETNKNIVVYKGEFKS